MRKVMPFCSCDSIVNVEEAGWTPNVTINRLWEAFRSAHSYTEDFAVPILEAGERTLFEFKGSAVISQDRMVGMLSRDETLLINIFQEKYSGGTIELTKDASVLIKKVNIRNKARWPSSGPLLKSSIHMDVVITENHKEKSNEEVAKDLESLLQARATAFSVKLRGLKADILGCGQNFRPRMSSQQLKDWKQIWYPKMRHEIVIRVNIRDNLDFKENVKYTK